MITDVAMARSTLQLHGAAADGRLLFQPKRSRDPFLRCPSIYGVFAIEAGGCAHHRARKLGQLDYEVWLMTPRDRAIRHGKT